MAKEEFQEFVELPIFKKKIEEFGDEDLLKHIQDELLKNPSAGVLLKGGIRKARIAPPKKPGGKSGGYRVWHYFFSDGDTTFLLYLLSKREAGNISKKQEALLVEALKRALGK